MRRARVRAVSSTSPVSLHRLSSPGAVNMKLVGRDFGATSDHGATVFCSGAQTLINFTFIISNFLY